MSARQRFVVVGLVALGLALRGYHYFREPSMWHDEAAVAVNVLNRGYADLLGPLTFHEAAPPLFLWLEKAVCLALGDGVFALRLPAFLASCLALPLLAWAASRLLEPRAVPWAVFLFAVSEQLAWHACEAKPYAFDVLAAVFLLALYAATRTTPLGRRLMLFALPAPVLIFLSYPACFLYGGVLAATAPAVWRRRSRRRGRPTACSPRRSPALSCCSSWGRSAPSTTRPSPPAGRAPSPTGAGRGPCRRGRSSPHSTSSATAASRSECCWRRWRCLGPSCCGGTVGGAWSCCWSLRCCWPWRRRSPIATPTAAPASWCTPPPPSCCSSAPGRRRRGTGCDGGIGSRRPVWPCCSCRRSTRPAMPSSFPGRGRTRPAACAFVESHREPADAVAGNDWTHQYYFRRLGPAFHPDGIADAEDRCWIVYTAEQPAPERFAGAVGRGPAGWVDGREARVRLHDGAAAATAGRGRPAAQRRVF